MSDRIERIVNVIERARASSVRSARARWGIQLLAVLCTLNAACGGDTAVEPDEPLILEVSVATSGGDPDYSYQIVAGSQTRTVGPYASTRFSLPRGVSTVRILDVATNCAVNGAASREVDLRTTSSISFEVACEATGLEIQLNAEGKDIPLGFTIIFDQVSSMKVPANTSFTMTRMEPGVHEVSVQTPYNNCVTPPGATVEVSNRVVKHLDFTLRCEAIERPELIVYTADADAPEHGAIEAVGPDGQGRRRLVAAARNPAWSPDGRSLAYEHWVCDAYDYWYYGCILGISIIDPETREVKQVTLGDLSSQPAWSPKADVIAVSRMQSTRSNIFLVSLDGQSTKLNLDATLNASGPSWSPDAERIAFLCVVDPLKSDICIANRNGTGFVRLTSDAHAFGRP
ncbi:MAG TPA: hypothetical protein VF042_08575, partial [Gemmatimonadaceae bacterium]